MAGRKITRRDYKKLNKVGEDRIFDSYVDEGSVEGLTGFQKTITLKAYSYH